MPSPQDRWGYTNMNIRDAIRASLRNIASYGDTDVFPFPFETHVFHDELDQCATMLNEMHDHFDDRLASYAPFNIVALMQVGHTGFRWATQIEPFWNAYYLALVVALADQIENKRIPETDGAVFSYRYEWQDTQGKLFKDSTWRHYRERALDLSRESEFVVSTDIADFYPRVYHHRIQNALNRLPRPGHLPGQIMALLSSFSTGASYGLPIGGPASRILAELALAPVDEFLSGKRLRFCRYADDYCIFCGSKSQAYEVLVFLSEKLFNEGLVLQKTKTRILRTGEFREAAGLLDPTATAPATDEQKLLNISIRYDPYSPTAEEDYERLKAAVNEVDIVGILGREVAKAAIDPTVTKQAINAIHALTPIARAGAIRTLLEPTNLEILSPVFVTVMRAVRRVYDELPPTEQDFVDGAMVRIYEDYSYLLRVELNLSYFVHAIAPRHTRRKEEILVELFTRGTSVLVRRLIILIMAKWECHYWLTDLKRQYRGLSPWEQRAFILASYVLGDEGKHWRQHTQDTWTPMDKIVRDWFSRKFPTTGTIPV